VVIDYLGILSDRYGKTNYERVSYISHQIKLMARILNVPVLAIQQLNRNADDRENHRPKLSDLRDSGDIEQDADDVILLYRDSYYAQSEEEADNPMTEIIIAKLRQGQSNRFVKVHFNKDSQSYISGDTGETSGHLFTQRSE